MTALTIPFADPDLFCDPHPLLHELRALAPVSWSDEMDAWVLLRYDDVRRALFDHGLASIAMGRRIERYPPDEQLAVSELREMVEHWMGLPRIEDHGRYCTLLRPRFAASAVRAMERALVARADRLLAAIVERGGGDVVGDFAIPYTIETVLELCGFPRSRSMADAVAGWVCDLSEVFHFTDLAGLHSAQRAARELSTLLRELISARRREPRDDLVGEFLRGLRSGLIYNEEEIVANLVMIIAVGFKTTSNLIATGVFLLLEHHRQLGLVRDDPSLCAGAVEEIARFDGPVFFTTRVAREDMRLGHEQLASGDLVLLCVAAANRDPAVFSSPDEFIVTRAKNPHLAFGAGAYSCLGAGLARAECRIAFERLLCWMPEIEMAGDPDWYEFPPLARWLGRLPIRCSPRPHRKL